MELNINTDLCPDADLSPGGDTKFWRSWSYVLQSLVVEMWIAEGNCLDRLVVRVGGALGAGIMVDERNTNNRYRSRVLMLLKHGICALRPVVIVEGVNGEVEKYLTEEWSMRESNTGILERPRSF